MVFDEPSRLEGTFALEPESEFVWPRGAPMHPYSWPFESHVLCFVLLLFSSIPVGITSSLLIMALGIFRKFSVNRPEPV